MVQFRSIPTVLTGDELVDKVFKRASRITTMSHVNFNRLKATEIDRVRSVQNTLSDQLDGYVKAFPSFGKLPPFYTELLQVTLNVDRLRKSLGALSWARLRINEVCNGVVLEQKRARSESVLFDPRKRAYGRVASILKQVDKDLVFLNHARELMRKLPEIDADAPTIVVAGYPNVGKSSFVTRVSTGTPEVAPYPFTTKGIVVGHVEIPRGNYGKQRFQIIDTPGLLDRDLTERNTIELQAILALQHLADTIVFILDPSEYCGYTREAQEHLLADVREKFAGIPIMVLENKADIPGVVTGQVEGRFVTSTETGAGLDVVLSEAFGHASGHLKTRIAAAKAAAEALAAAELAAKAPRDFEPQELEGGADAEEASFEDADEELGEEE